MRPGDRPSKFVRACNVYLPRHGEMALLAAVYNHGGLYAEKPGPVYECDCSDAELLGQVANNKLAECEFRENFDYSRTKPSDWPAFRASGLRTIKAFRSEFVWYGIRGANEANIIWVVDSPKLSNGVELTRSISAPAEASELGTLLLELHAFYQRVEDLQLDENR